MGLTPSPYSHYRGSLAWPIILITLGVLLMLDQFVPHWSFHRTWPVILVVFGVLKLIDASLPPRPPRGPSV
jgi:cell wall-active antibiotic response 4TMS protein YvqF